MDDLASRLSSILGNPAEMEKIRAMAQNLLEDNKPDQNSGSDIGKLLPMLKGIGSFEGDERVRLLTALKPHLSPERQRRADKAIGILKAASILPKLYESGILAL